MKTLKQFREEYDSNYVPQVDDLPEELVLEKREDKSFSTKVPSSKEMPFLLLFRRVQYRIFPNKQVVALYYSNTVDKYLSIPFGPGGNLNLSEAVIHDTLDEDWQSVNRKDKTDGLSQSAVNAYRRENPGSKLQTAVTEKNPKGKRASRRKSFCARMGGMKKRLTSAKTARDPDSRINKALRRWNCEEDFKMKLNSIRGKKLDENPLLNAILGGVLDAASGAVQRVGKAVKDSSTVHSTEPKRRTEIKKPGSTWERQRKTNLPASKLSKLAQADVASAQKSSTPSSQKQVTENKISDIRNMIKENTEFKDLNINGRTITLNTSMAKRILEVYDSVNTKNKRIVESMLNEDLDSFKKLLNFSIRN